MEQDQHLRFHPYNIALTLLLVGLSFMFLALTAAFLYSRIENDLPALVLKPIFVINTIILLASSYTIHLATKFYKDDDTEKYKQAILGTILLSLVFLVCQFFGWKQLFGDEIFIATNTAVSYLYVISGLHFLHVIAGLPFLVLFYITAVKKMKEPHTVLIYFTNPEKRLKLKLLTLYWHFLDALWIYLIVFFLINALIP